MNNKEIYPKIDFINNKLEKQLLGFEKKSLYNKNRSIRQNISIAILGAIITILAGINIKGGEEIFRIAILIIGAIITVISTYKSFFNNKELWIKYTVVTNELKKVKSDVEFYLSGKEVSDIKLSVLDKFNERLDDILDKANKNWQIIRLKK